MLIITNMASPDINRTIVFKMFGSSCYLTVRNAGSNFSFTNSKIGLNIADSCLMLKRADANIIMFEQIENNIVKANKGVDIWRTISWPSSSR